MKKSAFTLAEALITLVVLGVVAALLIPNLSSTVNDGYYKAKRRAFATDLLSHMRNMARIYGKINKAEKTSSQTANEVFVTTYLANVLSLTTCEPDAITDCGFKTESEVYSAMSYANRFTLPLKNSDLNGFLSKSSDKMWAGVTPDGVSLLVAYNGDCDQASPYACVNLIYDINGSKGPNMVGKDVGFATVFNAKNPKVGVPIISNSDAGSASSRSDAQSYCSDLLIAEEVTLPSAEEAASIYYNRKMLGLTSGGVWAAEDSIISTSYNTGTMPVYCVYR